MKHVFGAYNSGIEPQDDPFHPFTPDEWSQQTPTMMRTYLIQNLPDPRGPEPVPSGPISSSRPTGYSAAAIELRSFKQGIKREIAEYTSLKDVTEVWHMAHFWVSYGRCTMPGSPMGRSEGLSRRWAG